MTHDCSTYGENHSLRTPGSPSPMVGVRRVALCLLLNPLFISLCLILSSPALSSLGVAEAAVIINQAQTTYSVSGQGQIYKSNQDMITFNPQGTTGTIAFYRYAGGAQPDLTLNVFPTSYSTSGSAAGPFIQLLPPLATGYPPLNLSNLKLQQTDFFHAGDPIFIVVTDMDRNIHPNLAETIIIDLTSSAGDKEILRLVETGDDTGVFAGYIQSVAPGAGAAANYDGKLAVTSSSLITGHYQDTGNQSENLTVTALVDPTGRLFDSSTGAPIDGATVTLINTATGKPATVLGDDGVSSFPATVTSGGTASDSGGKLYQFPSGGYRYPLVAPGTYRLEITPPTTYKVPSAVPDSALQSLPGAPYALSPASRRGAFVVNPGPIVRFDVPLDPLLKGLWMEKSAGKTTAAVGDFVPFRMRVTNADATNPASQVVVTDRLPHGLRYIKGSLRVAGVVVADPTIYADGMTIKIPLGDMAPAETKEITYVTQVTAGARTGSLITNIAYAEGTNITSNAVKASVTIAEDFFSSRSFLMGTVTSGACGSGGAGLEGVRIYLENGSYVVSDKKGMFHFEGVTPGTHVVQLDIDSLPEGYKVIPCEENSRFAGRSFSQFVDLQGGALWRVDFRVDKDMNEKPAEKPSATAVVLPKNEVSLLVDGSSRMGSSVDADNSPSQATLELTSSLKDNAIEYQLKIWVGAVPLTNARVNIQLPPGILYEENSSTVDGKPVAAPAVVDSALSYDIGATTGELARTLRFRATIEPSARNGELLTKATFTVNTPLKANQSTPVAENVLDIVKEEKRIPVPEIRLHPHFPTLGAELGEADIKSLNELANKLSGLDIESITVTGHTDNVRIASRNRHLYRDNQVLSMARAKSVGRYLMDNLHLPPAKLYLYGKGESRPIVPNKSAGQRALNRRVEVSIRAYKSTQEIRQTLVKNNSGILKTEINGKSPAISGETYVTAAKTGGTLQIEKQAHPAESVASPVTIPVNSGKETGSKDENRLVLLQSAGLQEQSPASAGSAASGGVEKEPEIVAIPPQTDPTDTAQASPGMQGTTAGEDDEQLPDFSMAWIENVPAGREWVWPPPVYFPSMPSTHIAIKHLPSDKVTVTVNGEEVNPILLEKILKHPNGSVSVSYWRGVHLLEGDNRIVAIIKPVDNSEAVTLERILHVSTSPVRAELVPELSNLTADGKKPPVIALRLFDKDDYPIREGMTGKFAITAPYESYVDPELAKLNDLVVKGETKYIVGKQGVALIRLQPTNRTGEVIVTIPYANNREEPYRAWLTPQKREWILVGLAEGTAGYNTVSGHMENLHASGAEDKYFENGRVAFFAKGTIKGEWLLTMAYDSAKTTTNSGSSLFQTINPNSYYTLYGDNSQQQYDAASARKLFLKIERNQFYALFGDYNTGLTTTELSRYSRSLNGIKSEYQGKDYEFNVFASETGQSFTKDEIRGEGTSGLYRLTRKNIVMNSDKITIEVRDRFRSEVIVTTRSLARYLDYSIDYDNGTILFKEPIPSRDENFNPYYIVVDYETMDVGKESLNYGGRVGVKFLNEKVKTGFTYIHEDQLAGKGDSYGLDSLWQIAAGTRLKAEVARTDTSFSGVKRDALAWLAEAEHRSPKFEGKIYYRELEQGFGLGQQAASEAGTRKAGAEALYKMSDALSMNGQLYRQYDFATGGQRDLIEGKATYTYENYAARLGLRHVSDSVGDGNAKTSDQLTTGGSWLTLNKKLAFHLDHDQSIGGNSSVDFPTRTTFGADLKVTEKTTVFAQQEFSSGAGTTSNSTRAGIKSSPWEGGSVNSSMEQNMRENGDRLFALFGLKQNWKLTDKLSLDGSLDRSQTIMKSSNYSQTAGTTSTITNSDDFTAVSVGTSYIEKQWNWNSRLEYRAATSENKWGVQTSFVGEPSEGWGWSARFQLFDSQASVGGDKANADLRIGLVYRPPRTKWIVLDRIDLLFDRQQGLTSNLESRRIVNNLVLNYTPNRGTQLSFQYGAKYSLETIDSSNYSGYTDLIGIEGRYDLTKKWDIGVRGSLLHSWSVAQFNYSAGPSVGFNVMENAWISLGYNVIGFTDKDFSAADYTAQGPYVRFRIKFDQKSVKDAAGWLNKQ